jgi:predicted amidohydrolase
MPMRVTIVQLDTAERPRAAVLEHALDLLEQARGSDLILLPELWPCGYFAFDRYASEAEPVDGPLVQALAAKACDLDTHLFTGSFVERAGDRLYNTSLLIDPSGAVVARYRKMHLFGYLSEEARLVEKGDEIVVKPVAWGRAGFAICYDLRFPELFRAMVNRGAEVFLIPAAWPTDRIDAWVLLNRARALENQAFVFACNGAGTSGGVQLGGHSVCVDPFGAVIAEAGETETLLTVDIQLETLRGFRRDFPALDDRVLG